MHENLPFFPKALDIILIAFWRKMHYNVQSIFFEKLRKEKDKW